MIEDKNLNSISPGYMAGPVWWETAEEHRFALEVLQLGLRRKMLGAIARSCTSLSQIEKEFRSQSDSSGVSPSHAGKSPGC